MKGLDSFENDVLATTAGDLRIFYIGHGSLAFEFNGLHVYVDPFSRVADYSAFPKADLVLITHEHMDHLDLAALGAIRTDATAVVWTEICEQQQPGGIVLHNGDETTLQGIRIQAVPAYNMVHKRDDGQPFHPKGAGNGYVLTFGEQRIYVAGDTEDIPEMQSLQGIAVAFLPVNLPYTMTPAMAASAARSFHPRILVPYHFGSTDTAQIVALLKNEPKIEVRIRKLS
jgi:L-ascorbate metabolism protein UlaG (beta-lactamase superfamily)